MRATLARTLLCSTIIAVGMAFASSSMAQTLLSPGGAGDTAAKKTQQPKEIQDAIASFKTGDLDAAEKSLIEAVKKDSTLPPAEMIMMQFCYEARQGELMMHFLEKAVQKNPDDPEAYLQMGEIFLNQRRVAAADLLFAKAASLLANFNKSAERKAKLMPRLYSDMASVAELREDWATMQKHFEECLKLEPKNAMVMQRIAKALFQQKKAKESLEMLKKAAAVPEAKVLTPEAQLAIFYLQFDKGDPENAKVWIKRALDKAPQDLNTRLEAARVYIQTGKDADLEESKKQAAEAMKLDPKSLDALMLSGVISLFQKKYSEAADIFEKAAVQSPSNFGATNNLALALVELKDDSKKRRALEYATENVKKTQGQGQNQNAQNMAEALSTLGWVLYRISPTQNLADADKLLQQSISTNSYNPDTLYYAAVVAQANNRPKEAQVLLNRALKITAPWPMKNDAKALLEQLNK